MGKKNSLTIPSILSLLENSEFCQEADIINQQVNTLLFELRAESPETYIKQVQEIAEPFIMKWGVPPPPGSTLFDRTLKRDQEWALTSGSWGLIPVFPWTRADDVSSEVQRIKKGIGRRHLDAIGDRRKDAISTWLSSLGFSIREITRDFWGRETKRQSPSQDEIWTEIKSALGLSGELPVEIVDLLLELLEPDEDFSPKKEKTLQKDMIRAFIDEGIDETNARGKSERIVHQARAFREGKGSEAPAILNVRKAIERYRERLEAHAKVSMTPTQFDPISYPITMLIRTYLDAPAKSDEMAGWMLEIMRWLAALNDALKQYPTET